ncbi:MAG: FkbM family methyltransferase [Oculatellaceae cyanobacterium bins.114]|nr:FkbM family methyltransferase [Oculatellaceae cyanobacterium bins.114]
MQPFLRKLKSVHYLLTHEGNPLDAIALRIDENIRQYILHSKHSKPFTYKTKLGFNYLCLPKLATSTNLYVHQRSYEEIELEISKSWLQVGDSCLDLGANIGYFSTLFAAKVGKTGQVIAIEASPTTVQHLQQVIQTLKLFQIQIEPVCVTDTNGFVEFMVGCDEGMDVRQSLKVSPELETRFKKQAVPSTTLDSLIQKHQISDQVSLIKMDIEGAEALALRSGSLLFKESSLPLFIVEVYKLGLQRMGFEPKDIFNLFSAQWFELYYINRTYPNLTPEFPYGTIRPLSGLNDLEQLWHSNLIAIPKVGKYAYRKVNIMNHLAEA